MILAKNSTHHKLKTHVTENHGVREIPKYFIKK